MRRCVAIVHSLFVLLSASWAVADTNHQEERLGARVRGEAVFVGSAEGRPANLRPLGGPGSPAVLFLNRSGGHYAAAWSDDSTSNQSYLLDFDVDMPVFPYGDRSWQDVLDCVRDLYADFNIEVTDVDPGRQTHVEVVISGQPQDIGQSRGVAGIATFGCEPIDNAVVYAFAEAHGDDPTSICETAGQESAHAFGLDHEMLCSDIMTYLQPCGGKGFQDEDASCGEYQARRCSCGGATQNSYQYLMDVLGPAQDVNQSPRISISSPADGAVVDPGFAVEVQVSDDSAIDRVELWIDGEQVDTSGAAPWTTHAPSDLAPGSVDLDARAYDDEGARASATIGVDVTDAGGEGEGEDPGPIDDPGSDPGVPGGVGAVCEAAEDCLSSACVTGEGYCTDRCEGSACPDGFECSDTPDGAFCLRDKPRERGGCGVAPGSGAAGAALLGLLLSTVGLALFRRRRP